MCRKFCSGSAAQYMKRCSRLHDCFGRGGNGVTPRLREIAGRAFPASKKIDGRRFPCYHVPVLKGNQGRSAGRADRLTPKPTPFKGGREVRAYAVQSNGSDYDPHHGNNHGEDRKNHGNKRKHHDAANHRSAKGRQRLNRQKPFRSPILPQKRMKVNGTEENGQGNSI